MMKKYVFRTFHALCILAVMTGCVSAPPPLLPMPVSTGGEGGLPSSGKYRGVVIADMDNDGNPDVVGCTSSPGTVAIWYGNGKGGMSPPLFLPIKGDVRSVATGDVNGDGLADIVFSVQKESSGIMVWLNLSDRRWERGISPAEGNNYEGVRLADINSDGHLDIIAANATRDSQGGIQVWPGDGRGKWAAETGPTVSGIFMDVEVADFNHDGIPDLAASGWGIYGSLKIWLGDARGNWIAQPDPEAGNYYALHTTDVNGDGHTDILAGTYRSGIRVFMGKGDGHFPRVFRSGEGKSFWKVLAADMDGNGRKDLLASSPDGGGIRIWRRNGPARWEAVTTSFPSVGTYYEMAIGDLNKDNIHDICAASFGEGVKLWSGKGGYPLRSERGAFPRKDGSVHEPEMQEENDVYSTVSGFPEYRIGPGDLLEITMWKRSESIKEEVLVRPDGNISFAFVENLQVTGLTPTQLDQRLTEDLKRYFRNPRIDVVIKEYRSKFVTFAGEIYTNVTFRSGPGRYELSGKISLLEMLSKVGGPTQQANLQDVRVRNKNGQSFSVDMYKTINYGDESQNVIINDGDLVMIPTITREANRVYVFGEVGKPGVYTFSGSEMFLFDAISQAGGVTVFSTAESTRIIRGDITRPEIISADLTALIENGDRSQNVALANGDLVYVPRSFIGDINRFVEQITPIMQLVLTPARIGDAYWYRD